MELADDVGSVFENLQMTTTILLIIHIVVCFFMVGIVLLQHGKGADMGATFGGSGNTMFGTEGPLPLLNKITTGAAVIFMVTSVSLAYFSGHKESESVMSDIQAPTPVPVEQPAEQPPLVIPLPDSEIEKNAAVPTHEVTPSESSDKPPETTSKVNPVHAE